MHTIEIEEQAAIFKPKPFARSPTTNKKTATFSSILSFRKLKTSSKKEHRNEIHFILVGFLAIRRKKLLEGRTLRGMRPTYYNPH